MNVTCTADPCCPILLNSRCVYYEGANLVYIGVNTNDSIQVALEKMNELFQSLGPGAGIHNMLTGLQGGATDEYYHLSESDYNGIQGLLYTPSVDTLNTNPASGERGVVTEIEVVYSMTTNDDTYLSATINQGIGNVLPNINTGANVVSWGTSSVSVTFTLAVSYTGYLGFFLKNKVATYNAYTPQFAGVSAEIDYTLYADINTDLTKYVQSTVAIDKESSPVNEYIWFISTDSNATILDQNNFLQTVGPWNDGVSEFYTKPLLLTLADNITTSTVYLYRSRNTKTLVNFTYKIS
jgi:hypothetical protein